MPWFAKGDVAVKRLAGLAIAAVSKRLTDQTDRVDLLSKLQEGKDDEGRPMGREELTAEAQTQLIAGSDTTSKYVFIILFLLVFLLFFSSFLSFPFPPFLHSFFSFPFPSELTYSTF